MNMLRTSRSRFFLNIETIQILFSQEKINSLPEDSKYHSRIDLIPEAKLSDGPIYPLSTKELDMLWDHIREMEDHGKIRRSSSPIGTLILFVPKPDGTLRLSVDYRELNTITIKNKYLLPLMTQLRSRLAKATIFTKLDLKNGYYLICIAEGEEWKTTLSRYGLYEYTMMTFGLCNARSTFQSMINDVFRDMLDVGVITYMDEILIYTETVEEHVALVMRVIERLRKASLYVSIQKSSLHQREVQFLGFKISNRGISMTSTKVEEIRPWSAPKKVIDVQTFMGCANLYRQFRKGFSKIAKLLTDLTKKDIKWLRTSSCEDHAPRPLFSSRLKYFPHSANINLRVWSLSRHDTSILAFHLGFIFK